MADGHTPDALAHIAGDWWRYRRLDRLVNHWDRPGWVDGRRSYHWLVAFESAELRELATKCQAQLRHLAYLDFVPLEAMHVTLQRVAFTDQISLSDAWAVAEQARAYCRQLAPFDLTIGPLAGSAGAVRFSVGPHEPVGELRAAVRTAITDVLGADAVPGRESAFVPHLSIAYSNAPVPAGPVVSCVEQLRALGSVQVRADAVDLVELRRDGRSYAWQSLVKLDLGRGSPA